MQKTTKGLHGLAFRQVQNPERNENAFPYYPLLASALALTLDNQKLLIFNRFQNYVIINHCNPNKNKRY